MVVNSILKIGMNNYKTEKIVSLNTPTWGTATLDTLLVVLTKNKEVIFYETENKKQTELQKLNTKKHTERSFRHCCIGPNGRDIFFASFDGNIYQFKRNSENGDFDFFTVLEGPKAELKSVSVNEEASLACVASRDKNVWVFQLDSLSEWGSFQILQGHTADVKSAVFVPRSNHIVSCGYDGKLVFWAFVTTTEENTWELSRVFEFTGKRIVDEDVAALEKTVHFPNDSGSVQTCGAAQLEDVVLRQIEDSEELFTLWKVKTVIFGESVLVITVGEQNTIAFFAVNGANMERLVFDSTVISITNTPVDFFDLETRVRGNQLELFLAGSCNTVFALTLERFSDRIETVSRKNLVFENEQEFVSLSCSIDFVIITSRLGNVYSFK